MIINFSGEFSLPYSLSVLMVQETVIVAIRMCESPSSQLSKIANKKRKEIKDLATLSFHSLSLGVLTKQFKQVSETTVSHVH